MDNERRKDTSRRPLVIISGPTATGKTSLAVRLAKDIGGEIISADSMQVYRYMDIGTAKVTKEEMQGVPHFMIDTVLPSEAFSIADYKTMASACIRDIESRGNIPIVAGGTGFYIHALLYDTEFEETPGGGREREELTALAEEKGNAYLYERLKEEDPEAALTIHPNNIRRVIRALEYRMLTGERISEHNRKQKEKDSPYDFLYFALNREREALNEAIDRRVDRMMEAGLYEEVQKLLASGYGYDLVSMQGIGYKEFSGCTPAEAAEKIKLNSRHYAKRQVTWLKREKNVTWVEAPVKEEDYRWIREQCMKLSE